MSEEDSYIEVDTAAFSEFINEFQHESDRAAAILAGAYLDNLLSTILENYLISDNKNSHNILYGNNSPLYTFHSRILCSYGLGLIPTHEFKDLLVIKKIRNAFAHKQAGLSFSSQSITDQCKKLMIVQELQNELRKFDWSNSRNLFIYEVAFLTVSLNFIIGRPPDRCIPAKKKHLHFSSKPVTYTK